MEESTYKVDGQATPMSIVDVPVTSKGVRLKHKDEPGRWVLCHVLWERHQHSPGDLVWRFGIHADADRADLARTPVSTPGGEKRMKCLPGQLRADDNAHRAVPGS